MFYELRNMPSITSHILICFYIVASNSIFLWNHELAVSCFSFIHTNSCKRFFYQTILVILDNLLTMLRNFLSITVKCGVYSDVFRYFYGHWFQILKFIIECISYKTLYNASLHTFKTWRNQHLLIYLEMLQWNLQSI